MTFETTAEIASFGGRLLKLTHNSTSTKCEMKLNLYLPPQATKTGPLTPVIFYLAGLTCTGDNGAEKAFFQSAASKHGIAIVYPDTSPRTPKGTEPLPQEDEDWDFGSGAGFYVDATRSPWSSKYKMYSYITKELPEALFGFSPELDRGRISIMGHSMGGHGALTLFLKNPGMYKSVSAFSPISNPSRCPWGQKAFKGYFGDQSTESKSWEEHDATSLVGAWKGPLDVLIDVGTGDAFYKQKQLLPENFVEAAKKAGDDKHVQLRLQEGYDHSYFFISTFATDHINHHAKYLFSESG